MSYDLRILVKVEGCDDLLQWRTPIYDSPTYNLRDMFVACMDWDYEQGKAYNCADVIHNVERGIRELRTHRKDYKRLNPPNGWGNIDSAIKVLESLRECIYDCAEEVPIEHLWMRW